MDEYSVENDSQLEPEEQEYMFGPAGLSLRGEALRRVADDNVVADIDLKDVTEIQWQAHRDVGCIFVSIIMLGGAGVLGYYGYSETKLLITAIVLGVLGLLGIYGNAGTRKMKIAIKTSRQKFEFACDGSVDDLKAFLYEIDKHARRKGYAIIILAGGGELGID